MTDMNRCNDSAKLTIYFLNALLHLMKYSRIIHAFCCRGYHFF